MHQSSMKDVEHHLQGSVYKSRANLCDTNVQINIWLFLHNQVSLEYHFSLEVISHLQDEIQVHAALEFVEF